MSAGPRVPGGVDRRVELARIAVTLFDLEPPDLPSHTLSQREREVIDLLIGGLADKQIAVELGVKIGTIRTHLDR